MNRSLTRSAGQALCWLVRPLKAVVRPFLNGISGRIAVQVANEAGPFAPFSKKLDGFRADLKRFDARHDKLEAFQWDHVALARRLASVEDHLQRLLERTADDVAHQTDDAQAPAIVFGKRSRASE